MDQHKESTQNMRTTYLTELPLAPDTHWHERIWKANLPPYKCSNHQETNYDKYKDVGSTPALRCI